MEKILRFIQVKLIFPTRSQFFNETYFLDWEKSKKWFFPQDIALLIVEKFEIGINRKINPICLPYDLGKRSDKKHLRFIGKCQQPSFRLIFICSL